MLGGRKPIAAIVLQAPPSAGLEASRAGPVAVSSTTPVDFPPRLLRAASYNRPVLLRPTPAPCSSQEGIYGLRRWHARAAAAEKFANCDGCVVHISTASCACCGER